MSLASRIEELTAVESPEAEAELASLRQLWQDPRLTECLDDGFVRLVDVMGDDAAIVQAARVSYGAGTKTPSDDRTLIRYLMRHHHTSPLEQVVFKFHIRMPMDCHRQHVRHRMARLNEYSTRYSEAIDSAQQTPPYAWRAQSNDNKQGSSGTVTAWPATFGDDYPAELSAGQYLSNREASFQLLARQVYEERLQFGVAREQARKDLPLSTYTEMYWQMDLHNLLHYLRLRLDAHAQQEIRTYAEAMAGLIRPYVPLAWEAFVDYRLNAVTFNGPELEVLRRLIVQIAAQRQPLQLQGRPLPRRELQEFRDKLQQLGIDLPATSEAST